MSKRKLEVVVQRLEQGNRTEYYFPNLPRALDFIKRSARRFTDFEIYIERKGK